MALHRNSKTAKQHIVTDVATRCASLAALLRAKEEDLIEILLEYESFETAYDEVWRSLDCVENIDKEMEWLSAATADRMCTFFPVNLPLYSLVVFALVPSFMAREVIIRPPLLMRDVLNRIWNELELANLFPNIHFVHVDRNLFTEGYASVSDVILFTGRYHNARAIQEMCPDALFIYNGAGVNPVVVTDTADIMQAVHKTIEMRAFNSGQDCAGSDVIFVHQDIAEAFKEPLLEEIKKVPVGDYTDKSVRVGKIVKADQLPAVQAFIEAHAPSVLYGGTVDLEAGIVHPTVIMKRIEEISTLSATEFFSPVFYVVVYRDEGDLKEYFSRPSYSDNAMYVSLFGSPPSFEIPNSIVLENKIVNDVERGNTPYGGYGPKANYVSYQGRTVSRPLLISYEICAHAQGAQ